MACRIATFLLLFLIRAYQFAVRPLLAGSCKFVPSCSEYAAEAVSKHGPWRGAWLGVRRLCRCHPWSSGGIDPVP
jgi:putative membrane protein insertion efficiency factor